MARIIHLFISIRRNEMNRNSVGSIARVNECAFALVHFRLAFVGLYMYTCTSIRCHVSLSTIFLFHIREPLAVPHSFLALIIYRFVKLGIPKLVQKLGWS